MFNWFKNKKVPSNVVPFPAKGPQGPQGYIVPPVPEVTPPKEEKPAHTYYRLGITSDNRVSLAMGYSEITMNAAGIDNLIKQLEVFREQISSDYDPEEDDE